MRRLREFLPSNPSWNPVVFPLISMDCGGVSESLPLSSTPHWSEQKHCPYRLAKYTKALHPINKRTLCMIKQSKTIPEKNPKRILSFKQFLAVKYPKKSSSSVGNAEVGALPDAERHHPTNRSIISGDSTLLDLNRT